MPKLTQKRLKEVLDYDPETGVFTWKESRGSKSAQSVAGSVEYTGYITIRVYNKKYSGHRLAWLWMEGYFPENIDIDHIDRDKANNSFDNLRLLTRKQNCKNCNIKKNNKSGVTGVYIDKRSKRWTAQIRINGKNKFLGYFKNKIDAIQARWTAEKEFNFAKYNTTSSAFLYLQENKGVNK